MSDPEVTGGRLNIRALRKESRSVAADKIASALSSAGLPCKDCPNFIESDVEELSITGNYGLCQLLTNGGLVHREIRQSSRGKSKPGVEVRIKRFNRVPDNCPDAPLVRRALELDDRCRIVRLPGMVQVPILPVSTEQA